jgi:mRNA interferase RelE/StbE
VAAYRLLIKASAGRELERLGTKSDRRRIVERIQALANDPRPHGSEKLAGYADRYRMRQGNFRVVYLIDDQRREVTIFKVGDRKDVYR